MTFWDHLEELRKRLFLSVLVILVFTAVCYNYWDVLLKLLLKPAGHRELVYLNITEPFVARFKLAMWGGFLFAFPFVLYQVLAFIIPGLNRKEKIFSLVMVIFMVILFYGGVYFGYKYILKIGITWLESQGSDLLKANLSVTQYISFVGLFLLAFGVSFETPAVVVFLTKLGLVKPKTLLTQWRVALVVILITSAVITPDWSPMTMTLMAIPMTLLYLLGVVLSFVFAPRKKADLSTSNV